MRFDIAFVAFNNGNGALLCNECRTIIAYGFDHEDAIHLCPKCASVKLSELDQELDKEIERMFEDED